LRGSPTAERQKAVGTGTYDRSVVALPVVLTADKRSATVKNADKMDTKPGKLTTVDIFAGSAVKETASVELTSDDWGGFEWAMRDSNPRLPACKEEALWRLFLT
jgi:hypothetical protein